MDKMEQTVDSDIELQDNVIKTKKLTTLEATCIVAGYGIGSGVMAVPLFVSKVGIWGSLGIILAAYFISTIFHLLLAEISMKTGGGQIITSMQKLLFKKDSKFKKIFTWVFFSLMGVTLLGNLAVYIAGAGEILSSQMGISIYWTMLMFYVFAAGVSFFGLKIIGVCEKYAIFIVMAILAVLAIVTFTIDLNPLPQELGGIMDGIGLYGKIMFVFVAFFSVPQVVDGLRGDTKKIKKAIFSGISINLIVAVVVALCTLLAVGNNISETGIAIIDWTSALPKWAAILGTIFTILAFLTTYWAISLALADIIKEQVKTNQKVSWLIATLPSLALVLLAQIVGGGFLDFLNLAGGVIAILIVFMLIPVMRQKQFKKDPDLAYSETNPILGVFSAPIFIIIVAIGYVFMAIGSLV